MNEFFLYSLAERKYELYQASQIFETEANTNEEYLSRIRYEEVNNVINMLPIKEQKTVVYYFNKLRR